MTSSIPHLSLFVACYNEEENILDTLDNVRDALRGSKVAAEILVVDDASSDRSCQLIREWIQQNPEVDIRLIENTINKGLAANFIFAAKAAKGEWYRLICGDNVEPMETLLTVFSNVGRAEILLPYHIHCPGKVLGRKMISTCYTFLVNVLSGHWVRYYNGLPVTRRAYAKSLCRPELGFGFQADFVTQLLDLGLTRLEIPVKTQERSAGKARALTKKNFKGVSVVFKRIIRRRLARILGRTVASDVREDEPEIATSLR
jgi:glycosyltransferase involved in cell wall biosynthesis